MTKYSNNKREQMYSYFSLQLRLDDYKRGWMKGDCPYCGREKKFGINIEANSTNCFICGPHGHLSEVIMDLENLNTYPELWIYLNSIERLGYKKPKVIKEHRVEITKMLPEGFRLMSLGKSKLGNAARKYMVGRGYDITELSRKGVGYCNTGNYFGYIIVPYYREGKIVYFNGRNFTDFGVKHKNPDMKEVGIGKQKIIYNWDSLFIYEKVFLVESATNALTIGDSAIGTGGKIISNYQWNEILKSPVKKVVIILDPDALDKAIDGALRLVEHKKVKIIQLDGVDDVNSIGKAKTLRRVYQNRYLSYKDILKIKNERSQHTYQEV